MKNKKMVRAISLMLVCCMVLTIAPTNVVAEWSYGDEETAITQSATTTTIQIRTADELAQISSGLTSAERTYVLANSIVLTHEWIPLPDFQGIFDGQGHTISNLFVLESSNRTIAGLFSTTLNATVKNVTVNISDAGITARGQNTWSVVAGGLIASARNTNISNVHVRGNVSAIIANPIGGDGFADATAHAGGLVGRYDFSGGEHYLIERSSAIGDVFANVNRSANRVMAGGLVGYATNPIMNNGTLTISNTYARGQARALANHASNNINFDGSGMHVFASGLAGGSFNATFSSGARIENSYSTSNTVAGLNFPWPALVIGAGLSVGIQNIAGSFGSTAQNNGHLGTNLTPEQMRNQASFPSWDFDNVWEFRENENDGFPVLRSQSLVGGEPIDPPTEPPTDPPQLVPTSRIALDNGVGVEGEKIIISGRVRPYPPIANDDIEAISAIVDTIDWSISDNQAIDIVDLQWEVGNELNVILINLFIELNRPGRFTITGRMPDGVTSRATITINEDINARLAGFFNPRNRSAYRYNHELATLAAELSVAVYSQMDIETKLTSLEMDNIVTRNFGSSHVHSVAHAFARRDIVIDGDNYELIIIVIKGTDPSSWQDWLSNFDIIGIGYHGGFDMARIRIATDLYYYTYNLATEQNLFTNPNRNILLVTGHSRGGAVASLLSAELNSHEIMADSRNIHTYTFASPRVRLGLGNVGYSNIFNIINRRDTVTPNLPPGTWHRYGIDLLFSSPRESPYPPHNMRTHLRWMQNNTRNSFYNAPWNLGDALSGTELAAVMAEMPRMHTFNSPVDVRVYDNLGNMVSEIENNVANNVDENNVFAFVIDDAKHVIMPSGESYTIQLIATGSGTLTYTVEVINMLTNTTSVSKVFENVMLYTGRNLLSEARNGFDYRLFITENSVAVGEIAEDGTETMFAIGGQGNNVSGNDYPSYQELLPTAVRHPRPEREQNIYQDDELPAEAPPVYVPETEWQPLILPHRVFPFIDVATTAWYYPYVRTVWEREIFQGTSHNQFSPGQSMTRAMFTQMLANHEGANTAGFATSRFSDVSANAWYFGAIEWAVQMGIVEGVGNSNFAPSDHITREQMAVMLYRYANVMGTQLPQNIAVEFPDQNTISYWAVSGVGAIQSARIITGRPDGNFDPRATATRAEVATLFSRFLNVTE